MTPPTLPRLSVRDEPTPLVAIDLVLLTIEDGALKVLMIDPSCGEGPLADWVLPGAFVQFHETVEDTAARVLREKANLSGLQVEQFRVFSAVERDHRDRVISVGFLALVPVDRLYEAAVGKMDLQLPEISINDGSASLSRDGDGVTAAYDHTEIIHQAVEHLRTRLDWSGIAFGLLPDAFTLLELQKVHEVIRGRILNKPAFRKRLLDARFPDGRRLTPTGTFTTGRAHRPAELYQLKV